MTHARCTPHGAEATYRKPSRLVATFVLGLFVFQPVVVAADPADTPDGLPLGNSGGDRMRQFDAADTAGAGRVPASRSVEPAGMVVGDFSRVGFDASDSLYAARFADPGRFSNAARFTDVAGFTGIAGSSDAGGFADAAGSVDAVGSVDAAGSADLGARLWSFAEAGLVALLVSGLLILAGINGLKRPPGSERRLPREG